MGQQEPLKIQQGQIPSPATSKEEHQAAVQAGDCLFGWGADLLKCPRHGGRQCTGHEQAVHMGSKERQHPGLYQHHKGRSYPPVFSTHESTSKHCMQFQSP